MSSKSERQKHPSSPTPIPKSAPGTVAGMAMALSLATYLLNSYARIPGIHDEPVVQTSTGLVRGNVAKSRDGRTYYEFLGIPYARPPVGDLRFERPVPVKPWKGVRSAQEYGSVCMQLEVMVTGRIQGDENCLFLNIFTPRLHQIKSRSPLVQPLLPVLVFLHGGLFMSGSSNMYRGMYFMDEDVVLLTLNYRLSALGFLNTGDGSNGLIKGNMGLWDQNMALRWAKDNVARFGGDPEQITLFGESAGASSVHYHMLSPHSSGLFHKAISQSGTALQIWALSRSPKTQAKQLAKVMGCPVENATVMVSCMKRVDAKKLVRYHISTMSPLRKNTDLFVPTVDGEFLPAQPIDLLRNGSFSKIPWITGVNSGEGLLNTGRILASQKISDNLWQNWDQWIPLMLDYDPKRHDISWKIKQYYFSQLEGKPVDNTAVINNLTQMYSDRVYFFDSRRAALLHAKHAPVYLYYYSYPGEMSFFRLFKAVMPSHRDLMAPELKIAVDVGKDLIRKYLLRQPANYMNAPCHADELILQFNTHKLIEVNRNSLDWPVSKSLVKSWAEFAKRNWTLSYQDSNWSPIRSGTINSRNAPFYMNINLKGHMIPEPFTKAIEFWETLGV